MTALARRSVAVIGTRGYPSYYGGFETAVRKLAPALADAGWRVRVYGREGATRPREADPRVESVYTRGVDSKSLSTLSFGLSAVLHALWRRPDVALVMNVANGFWLPLLRLRGIPTLVNVDGIEWEREKWSRLGKAVFRLGARFTARYADQLVFDAEAIADYWRREFGRSGVFIPYGGDPADEVDLREDLKPGGYVLLVARFVPENSIEEFLDAAVAVIERFDVDVALVGSAPPGDRLQVRAEHLASTHPRIRLLGHISDDAELFGLWRHAAAYFHGHTVGGTNPALVQAMALGARIAARDTAYNREVLAEAGHFCNGTPDSIVEAIGSTITDERDLPSLAMKRASEHYSWGMVIQRYADALESLRRRPISR